MINLLPPQQKEELKKEKNFKLVIIYGILALAFFASLNMIMLGINISVQAEVETQKIYLAEKTAELQMSKTHDLENKIKDLNSIFSGLNSFYANRIESYQFFLKISENLPPKTYLTNLSLSLNEDKKNLQVYISGFCPDRETLLTLKTNLEKEDGFSSVYFSPSNWVSPKDIIFTANLIMHK